MCSALGFSSGEHKGERCLICSKCRSMSHTGLYVNHLKPNPGDAPITLCAKGEHKGWSNLPLESVQPAKAFFSENKIQQERLIPKYQ